MKYQRKTDKDSFFQRNPLVKSIENRVAANDVIEAGKAVGKGGYVPRFITDRISAAKNMNVHHLQLFILHSSHYLITSRARRS